MGRHTRLGSIRTAMFSVACLSLTSMMGSSIAATEDENRPEPNVLLAVGPGAVHADETGSWITVLGQTLAITVETEFPRGLVAAGDYVAVEGAMSGDGAALASSIIQLGGEYSIGNSPVYVRGTVRDLTSAGAARIGDAAVDLAAAYADPALQRLTNGDTVEVLGFEVDAPDSTTAVIATRAAFLPKGSGSTLTGINGSGMRGINGSGMRGINGSGMRGINGSGMRGINGSGMRGINGSGMRGINGSGMRGINGSGMRGINGSGMRGINGSGMRGINGSGMRGINGSGMRGINGSGMRGINGSGMRGINGSGMRGINGSGMRGINGSGMRAVDSKGLE
ncbi:MAG: DUF5666 domain-containing protein [Gammaproteobacteria bacterium]|nr:MAG: DUF5666 domain-containing protein [Gammaproteobacteria bacterium]